MSTLSTLQLYRRILRNASRFPSIKRNKIIEEIKYSFRMNKDETDSVKVEKAVGNAMVGLQQLMQYSSLSKERNSWSVDLEKNPMPIDRK